MARRPWSPGRGGDDGRREAGRAELSGALGLSPASAGCPARGSRGRGGDSRATRGRRVCHLDDRPHRRRRRDRQAAVRRQADIGPGVRALTAARSRRRRDGRLPGGRRRPRRRRSALDPRLGRPTRGGRHLPERLHRRARRALAGHERRRHRLAEPRAFARRRGRCRLPRRVAARRVRRAADRSQEPRCRDRCDARSRCRARSSSSATGRSVRVSRPRPGSAFASSARDRATRCSGSSPRPTSRSCRPPGRTSRTRSSRRWRWGRRSSPRASAACPRSFTTARTASSSRLETSPRSRRRSPASSATTTFDAGSRGRLAVGQPLCRSTSVYGELERILLEAAA